FFLNSKLFNWYKRIKFVAYGDGVEDGRVKLEYSKMLAVPVKPINETIENRFQNLFNIAKRNKNSIGTADKEADALILKIYDFSYDECCLIHGNTDWMTKEEYENFTLE
ncbi:MAG: hypothetical protein ABIO05_06135, partial [Ferruginibacter sp.]